MRDRLCWVMLVVAIAGAGRAAAQGQVHSVVSSHDLKETIARFEAALHSEGIAAQHVLSETQGKGEDVVFENPYAVTYAGRCRWDDRQDQPFVTHIGVNDDGRVELRYSSPAEKVNDFGVIECGSIVSKINNTLNKLIKFAAQ